MKFSSIIIRAINLCLTTLILSSNPLFSQTSKEAIKGYFRQGNAPGEIHFNQLIDACYNYSIGRGLLVENNTLHSEVIWQDVERALQDTAYVLRNTIINLNEDLTTRLNEQNTNLELLLRQHKLILFRKIDSLGDIQTTNHLDQQNKLLQIQQNHLQLDNEVSYMKIKLDTLRYSQENFTSSLKNKLDNIPNDANHTDNNFTNFHLNKLLNTDNLLNQQKSDIMSSVDSLKEIHDMDKQIFQLQQSQLQSSQNQIASTQGVMKIKLDTLNYTEQNFTLLLKNKLLNIQDGATRSDNNFSDSLLNKLAGIEKHANNYQLPLGSYSTLGGVRLGPDFVIYKGQIYNALDPEKIDRQYATDTTQKNWTPLIKPQDQWTRIRLKIPTNKTDALGNKLFDYGEWNPPYKFNYQTLENAFYQYNATDSLNVILGKHEKQKAFLGTSNTLLGHNAGYDLYNGGDHNVMIGNAAGENAQKVSNNVFIGYQSGQSIGDPSTPSNASLHSPGNRNVAIGNQSMKNRNGIGSSIAMGYKAMESGQQSASIAIGAGAMSNNNGIGNIALGFEAAQSNDGSNNNQNISIGYRAAYKNMYANRNIALGDSSALSNESGNNNIYIGHGSGSTNKGSGNLIIGNDISPLGDHLLAIGNQGKTLISGDITTGEVSIPTLKSNQLQSPKVTANTYHNTTDILIDETGTYSGPGGVKSLGRIVSKHPNTPASGDPAISAHNGSIMGKYLVFSSSLHLNTKEVINSSRQFVGDGGIHTSGAITTSSSLSANTFNSKTINATQSLSAAGINIITTDNTGTSVERYSLRTHTHNYAEKTHTHSQYAQLSILANYAPKGHLHTQYAPVAHTHNYANKVHEHQQYALITMLQNYAPLTHNHLDYALKTHTHNYAEKVHTHTEYAPTVHKHTSEDVAGTIPIGGIIMWSGNITNIPQGWALCNGKNNTPDLRNRFIMGAGDQRWPGEKGGNKTVTLNPGQLPAHSHGAGSLTLSNTNIAMWIKANNNTLSNSNNIKSGVYSSSTTISGNTAPSGNGNPIEILPPYYALAFIMRIK